MGAGEPALHKGAETQLESVYYPDLLVNKPTREVRSLNSNGTSSNHGSPSP